VDAVKFLLAAYDDLTSQLMHMYEDLFINLLNFVGFTPLMLAAERGTRQSHSFRAYHKILHFLNGGAS